MDQQALKNADVLIMTGLTQTPTANPDTMLGELCVAVCKSSYCTFRVVEKKRKKKHNYVEYFAKK